MDAKRKIRQMKYRNVVKQYIFQQSRKIERFSIAMFRVPASYFSLRIRWKDLGVWDGDFIQSILDELELSKFVSDKFKKNVHVICDWYYNNGFNILAVDDNEYKTRLQYMRIFGQNKKQGEESKQGTNEFSGCNTLIKDEYSHHEPIESGY